MQSSEARHLCLPRTGCESACQQAIARAGALDRTKTCLDEVARAANNALRELPIEIGAEVRIVIMSVVERNREALRRLANL